MNKAELRRAMREQRKALRASTRAARAQANAALAQNPAVQRARRRRRLRRLLAIAAVLLLMLFVRCDCESAPVVAAPPAADAGEPVVKTPPDAGTPRPKKAAFRGRVAEQPRGAYKGDVKAPPSWLEEYRLQVAARSPRLSECFKGSDRPGALRWTSAVNVESGAVSDHELEALGSSGYLDSKQIQCLVAALSKPGYRIRPSSDEAKELPRRISIVIEF